MPEPARCCLSWAGVPVSSGNVPQCIGTTCFTPSHFAAIAAVSGPMVKRSPIGRNAMSGRYSSAMIFMSPNRQVSPA